MKALIFLGIGIASWVLGVFGFAQIVGSLRTVRMRGIGMTLFTVILWTLILGGIAVLVISFLPQYQIAMYIGYAISLVIMLFQKNIS